MTVTKAAAGPKSSVSVVVSRMVAVGRAGRVLVGVGSKITVAGVRAIVGVAVASVDGV